MEIKISSILINLKWVFNIPAWSRVVPLSLDVDAPEDLSITLPPAGPLQAISKRNAA